MGLFTTNNYHSKTELVPYEKKVTIKEHRAPTDESVRLLNEMEEKARQNIIATLRIHDNSLNGVVICYRDDLALGKIILHAKFSLNGQEYIIEDAVDQKNYFDQLSGYRLERDVYEYVIHLIHKKLSELIATKLMQESTKLIDRLLGGGVNQM